MRKTIEIVNCDICKTKTKNQTINLSVVFTTNQETGKHCKHYLTNEKVDLCDDCLNEILYKGKQIFGYGAQGCNTFYFKTEENIKIKRIKKKVIIPYTNISWEW